MTGQNRTTDVGGVALSLGEDYAPAEDALEFSDGSGNSRISEYSLRGFGRTRNRGNTAAMSQSSETSLERRHCNLFFRPPMAALSGVGGFLSTENGMSGGAASALAISSVSASILPGCTVRLLRPMAARAMALSRSSSVQSANLGFNNF